MAPLVLEGETLGQKHRYYNSLLKAALTDPAEPTAVDYDDPDIDNLLKIDIACSRRNVDYLLTVLQCDDMLYVSRAIKYSTWLITDDQYAHIINPKYLYDDLFPKMTSKAKNKLILAIRLNLRNESRVEEFFNYYRPDFKTAQKWLPHCSTAFIEKVVEDRHLDIDVNTYKRMFEKSIDILKLLLKEKEWFFISQQVGVSKGLLHKCTEEYLNLIEKQNKYIIPNFGVRTTRLIMQTCPERITKNFEKFNSKIHLPTFAKYFKKEDIKTFLIKQAENVKMRGLFKHYNLKYFLKYLPSTERFDFVKNLFIDKVLLTPEQSDRLCDVVPKVRSGQNSELTSANIYYWYRFAPFDTAFTDLKKMIRTESSPAERTAMLLILIKCAGRNQQHIHAILQYYQEKQINEPFKFKVQFVNQLLSSTATHKFDKNTWSILNDIFSSMEVYIESENSVPFCVKAIIVYKLIHKHDIPEVIENKLTFDTFENYRKKLGQEEQVILFTYLYNLEMSKLDKQSLNSEVNMATAFHLLSNILTLLNEWEKKLTEFPTVLEKFKHLIKLKKENSWNVNCSQISNMVKKWRKDIFEESLALDPSDKTCMNVLKHDPSLLSRWDTEVASLRSNDAISLKNTVRTLRIYWKPTLAQKWTDAYLEGLLKPTGHKATAEGICILLPRTQFLVLLQKYAPTESKIDWSNVDTVQLSLQKNIAKRMKFVRPSVPLDAVLSYSKGDYLQYALPSLNAVTYNMSPALFSESILTLFESPVSLQKHGLRLAFTKLKLSKIKDLVVNVWQKSHYSSIRTVLFKQTYDLLVKQKTESIIKELWELLNMFIKNLTQTENKIIYSTLGSASSIPMIVRSVFFERAYVFLKSLPAKANCEKYLANLDHEAPDIMDLLECSFVENVLLKSFDEFLNHIFEKQSENKRNVIIPILTSYILTCKDENIQFIKYEKYVVPFLNTCFASWEKDVKKGNCITLLQTMLSDVKKYAMKNITFSIKMFKDIEIRLRKALPFEENYFLITHWNFAVLYIEALDNYLATKMSAVVVKSNNCGKGLDDKENAEENWKQLCNDLVLPFAESCKNYIKQDISSRLSNLAPCITKGLMETFNIFNIPEEARFKIYKQMLDSEVLVTYLIALEGIASVYYLNKELIQLKREACGLIRQHPSPDVQIHYLEKERVGVHLDETEQSDKSY